MTATLLAALALAVALLALYVTPLGLHWLSLQPGGANDPAATATPEATLTPMPQRVWLPWMEL